MLSKKEQLVITGIRCLSVYINNHVDGWDKELNENDGYLNDNFKNSMYTFKNAINKLQKEYENTPVTYTYRDKFIDEVKDYNFILKGRNKKTGTYQTFSNEAQRHLPYEDFINDFYMIDLFLIVIQEKYEKTVQQMGIEPVFDDLIKAYNYYSNFFEKEIVIM
ncbi:hypothetical protein IX317_002143 [Fusobacterium sp. DD29]|uniref:hypothetical protein n=1 Tax=unclassified Fusobacterium TaxID=2648384 RepID=UPI001B8AA598|nr:MULTISPECIES: hypothetical protein [unclassified Fusobacterium]MBR8750421.1 hypothetical protein [Fusobacterium sp. DD29]MBR8762662.1 hypothetical protein [Fusobacterium sp. DD25]MBR8768681.1 hypothetical protein [Fusobacterium sp. DD43]MBR8772754.1 hypothetical protein [Fusobacterium sp. DD40]MBR8776963.1 hypothetical protein [Fusobacterium sp. DD17]